MNSISFFSNLTIPTVLLMLSFLFISGNSLGQCNTCPADCNCSGVRVSWQTSAQGGPSLTVTGVSPGECIRVYTHDAAGNQSSGCVEQNQSNVIIYDYTVGTSIEVVRECRWNHRCSIGTFNTTETYSPPSQLTCECPNYDYQGREVENGIEWLKVWSPIRGKHTIIWETESGERSTGAEFELNQAGELKFNNTILLYREELKLKIRYNCNYPPVVGRTPRITTECFVASFRKSLRNQDHLITNINSDKKITQDRIPAKLRDELKKKNKKSLNILYEVPHFSQPDSSTCWASSISMILFYCLKQENQQSPYFGKSKEETVLNIKKAFGVTDRGLMDYDHRPLDHYGFQRIIPVMSLAANENGVDTIYNALLYNGPLLVMYDHCPNRADTCDHSIVVIGLEGDGTAKGTQIIYHDPSNGSNRYPNGGKKSARMQFSEFVLRIGERMDILNGNTNSNYIWYKPCL